MPDSSTLALFTVAALSLLLFPGPVVVYTVARSIHQGKRAGWVSTMATGLGDFCYALAAALGLSAILMTSAVAFSLVKYMGAAYLIYLGLRTLLTPEAAQTPQSLAPMPLRRVFVQGLWVSLLNPKTALFFLTFLPQFIDSQAGNLTQQTLILGALFVGLGVCTNGLYVLLAGTLAGKLRRSLRFSRRQRYFTGGIYITLGASTALSGSNASH